MGTFECRVQLEGMDGQGPVELEAMVDTGAAYSMVPASILRDLGVQPIRKVNLEWADGRQAWLDMGEARATIDGESVVTLVVFAEGGTQPLLGAYTLEGLGLAADPVNAQLIPMPKVHA